MKVQTGMILRTILAALVVVTPATMRAEVTRVEITSRQDVVGGKPFGTVGAYEKLTGKVYFAVVPENPHNRIVADIDKAPRNAQGKVEFSADLFILKPKDTSHANGVLFFDVVNRGNKALLSTFNHAAGSLDPATEAHFGNGLLMREGYTLVAVGWQFDVPKQKNRIGFDAPTATDNGQPITGWVSPWFIPNKRSDSFEYTTGYNSPAYPPLDPNNPAYRLTEREGLASAPRLIPRDNWQFGRIENGKVAFDANWVTLKGGFKAGMTYEVTYESKNPPLAGLGFAAIRDLASALKYNSDAVVRGRYAYTYGASQTGRFQRHMIYDGFTTDEQGRLAIDQQFALAFHDVGDLIAGVRMVSGIRSRSDLYRRDSGLAARDRYIAREHDSALYSRVLGPQTARCRNKSNRHQTHAPLLNRFHTLLLMLIR